MRLCYILPDEAKDRENDRCALPPACFRPHTRSAGCHPTVDAFLDLVSMFSLNGPNSFIDQLRASISGRPGSLLEISPSIYLEQFDTALPR